MDIYTFIRSTASTHIRIYFYSMHALVVMYIYVISREICH